MFSWKCGAQRLLARPRSKREDNIKADLKEIGCKSVYGFLYATA
jgi:hypothetical protein